MWKHARSCLNCVFSRLTHVLCRRWRYWLFLEWLEAATQLESATSGQRGRKAWSFHGNKVSSLCFHVKTSWDHEKTHLRVQGQQGEKHRPRQTCHSALCVSSPLGDDPVFAQATGYLSWQVVPRIHWATGQFKHAIAHSRWFETCYSMIWWWVYVF